MSRKRQQHENIFVSIMTQQNLLPIRRSILVHLDIASGWSLGIAIPKLHTDFVIEDNELRNIYGALPNFLYCTENRDELNWQNIFLSAMHWSLNTPAVCSLLHFAFATMPDRYKHVTVLFSWALSGGANDAVFQTLWSTILTESPKREITREILSCKHTMFACSLEYNCALPGSILHIVQFLWQYIYEPNMTDAAIVDRQSLHELFKFCVASQDATQTFLATTWLRSAACQAGDYFALPSYADIYDDAVYAQNVALIVPLWEHIVIHEPHLVNVRLNFTYWHAFAKSVAKHNYLLHQADLEPMLFHMFNVHGFPDFYDFWRIYTNMYTLFAIVPPTITQYMDAKYQEICVHWREKQLTTFELTKRNAFIDGVTIPFTFFRALPISFYVHLQSAYATEIALYITAESVAEILLMFSQKHTKTILKQWGLLHLLD